MQSMHTQKKSKARMLWNYQGKKLETKEVNTYLYGH